MDAHFQKQISLPEYITTLTYNASNSPDHPPRLTLPGHCIWRHNKSDLKIPWRIYNRVKDSISYKNYKKNIYLHYHQVERMLPKAPPAKPSWKSCHCWRDNITFQILALARFRVWLIVNHVKLFVIFTISTIPQRLYTGRSKLQI